MFGHHVEGAPAGLQKGMETRRRLGQMEGDAEIARFLHRSHRLVQVRVPASGVQSGRGFDRLHGKDQIVGCELNAIAPIDIVPQFNTHLGEVIVVYRVRDGGAHDAFAGFLIPNPQRFHHYGMGNERMRSSDPEVMVMRHWRSDDHIDNKDLFTRQIDWQLSYPDKTWYRKHYQQEHKHKFPCHCKNSLLIETTFQERSVGAPVCPEWTITSIV